MLGGVTTNGIVTVGTNATVRYGIGTSWFQKTVSGTGWCTNFFFGSDPAVGALKEFRPIGGR